MYQQAVSMVGPHLGTKNGRSTQIEANLRCLLDSLLGELIAQPTANLEKSFYR